MSRIGKAPISIPQGVEISVEANEIKVKGPKGELMESYDPTAVQMSIEDGTLTLTRTSDMKDHRAKHGLYRALIANMIEGVTNGFKKQLEFVGVGYRAVAAGQRLDMMVGYSHPIVIELPKEIKLSAETVKGKAPIVTLESIDKQLIGQVAAKIRAYRKPEPYKGKGIRYVGEFIRRKAGKSAAK